MKQIIYSNSKLYETFFYLEDLYPLKDDSFKEENIGLTIIRLFINILKVILKLLKRSGIDMADVLNDILYHLFLFDGTGGDAFGDIC